MYPKTVVHILTTTVGHKKRIEIIADLRIFRGSVDFMAKNGYNNQRN